MEFEFLRTLIRPEAFILIPVLYIIGFFLERTPRIPEWSHAWILLTIGAISCFLSFGLEIQSFIQAVLCTGAATLSKDLIHPPIIAAIEKRNGNNGKENGKEGK